MSELTANKKKQLMVGLLGLILVVAVVVRILPGGMMDSVAAAPSSGNRSLLDKDPGLLLSVASIAKARAERVYGGADLRDPMEALVRASARSSSPSPQASQAPAAPVQLPLMTLYGVIWDPDSPIAIIDGLDLRVGDKIKGARIVGIEFDSVSLSYRSKSFELTVD
jgi:hypothetical protein